MKKRFRAIFFVLGIAGIVVLALTSDWSEVNWDSFFSWQSLILFEVLLGLWFGIYCLHTIAYKVTLGKERKKVPFFSLLKIVVSGLALNAVTPAGLVGGEPYKIIELKRFVSTEKATSSTLIFTFFYIFGHIALWATTAILYFVLGAPGETYTSILLGIAGGLCLIGVIWFVLSRRKGFILSLTRFFGKLPFLKKPISKLLEKKEESFIQIDDRIGRFRTRRDRFWTVFGIEFLVRILEGGEYFLILYYLGANINIFSGIIVMGLASLIGNVLFLIPMQAGSREGGMAIALSFFDIASEIGVQTGIIYRVRDLTCILIGISLVMFEKHIEKKQEKVALKEDKSTKEG